MNCEAWFVEPSFPWFRADIGGDSAQRRLSGQVRKVQVIAVRSHGSKRVDEASGVMAGAMHSGNDTT
jgi:hypothetical protein